MAKNPNQKTKLLHLYDIFLHETDEEHGITVKELIAKLDALGINADRKTIYQDLKELEDYGLDMSSEQRGREVYHYVVHRDFELAELKLLVDIVQSAKFITEKKSRELIKKLEGLASVHEAKKLHREVIISGRVKTKNETIFYNVDMIHTAIGNNSQISFTYFQWDVNKNEVLRHGGKRYVISPLALIYDDEYYYLAGFDAEAGIVKHFRVDKMKDIQETGEARLGKEIFDAIDIPKYSKGLFGMFGGETVSVTLRCKNELAGVIIDRFGKDTMLIPADDGHFDVTVDVAPSQQFIGWVVALGRGVKVISPAGVIEKMRQTVTYLTEEYSEQE